MFSTEIFLPRGHAYLWTPWLVIAEIATNAAVALGLLVLGVRLVVRLRGGDPEALAQGRGLDDVAGVRFGRARICWTSW